eukprot:TRINITY_DN4373_c0_g1_i3.p1 TRINITY_DN4373_c0_g1~~TRINITY_DN4373_c0_g1_i3.p1  ORF type:complete len:1505 (+),score=363.53 TRINITY_DN4373_c0_g1_i3:203-4717(+)
MPAQLAALLQNETEVWASLRDDPSTADDCKDPSFVDALNRFRLDTRMVRAICALLDRSKARGGSLRPRPGLAARRAVAQQIFAHLPGVMGEIIRNKDWAATPLGPPETWPHTLLTSIEICLCSSFPMALHWSRELFIFYNDGYIPLFGARHPTGLGLSSKENWAEIYDIIGPAFLKVFDTGEPTYNQDEHLTLTRHGFKEEAYFTWSFGLIRMDDGSPGGIFNPAIESTTRVLSGRRLNLLQELASKVSTTQTVAEACESTAELFKLNHHDIPFGMIYLLEGKGRRGVYNLQLSGVHGLTRGHDAAPEAIEVTMQTHNGWSSGSSGSEGSASSASSGTRSGSGSGSSGSGSGASDSDQPVRSSRGRVPGLASLTTNTCSSVWPVHEVLMKKQGVEIEDLLTKFGGLPSGPWEEPPQLAAALPIATSSSSEHDEILGVLILGVNSHLLFDADYKVFFELLARQLATTIVTARSYEHERKRAEALAQVDHAKTQFFSNVSHELRTPLTLILGPIEDCLADPEHVLSSEHRAQLSVVSRNAQRLLKLVNSLLDFSRIEANRVQACFEPVDLPSLTADLASMFRATVEKAGLKLTVDAPPLARDVFVDKGMYEKIVFNLLSNAFKFTLHGSITVSVRHITNGDSKSDVVELAVADSGVGIPDDELGRVFERFHRVEGAQGRSYEGTGIGLALTLELVKLHGGTISVTSREGMGTTFTVQLPMGFAHLPPELVSLKKSKEEPLRLGAGTASAFVHEAQRWTPQTTEGEERDSHTRPESPDDEVSRILVADDNADMRQYLVDLFKQHKQYQIIVVCDGLQALQAALSRPPHLILSDVMMPHMDGFSLIQNLRKHPSTMHIPVVLLSARAGDEAKVEGLQAGADDYLAKPFSAKELLARVRTHLELGRMRQQLERQVLDRTRELQQSERKFRLLSELSPVGICQTDEQGMLIYANDRLLEMLDMTLVEALGSGWTCAMHRDDASVVQQWMHQTRAKGSFSKEVKFVRPDGSIVYTLLQTKPFAAESGNQFVAALVDITERKTLERERLEAMQQAEAEQRKRAQDAEQHQRQQELFVDTICHEIRNPLNGIVNNADLLTTGLVQLQNIIAHKKPDMQADINKQISLHQEAIDSIVVCAKHQQVITNDVLYLSKLESGLVQLNIVPFRPRSSVEGVIRMFDAEMAAKGIQVKTEFPDNDEPLWVRSDPNRLSQIMINLVSNAIKFTSNSAEKRITVSMTALPDPPSVSGERILTLQFSVQDTGIGMSDQDQTLLFQRFSQATRSTHQYGGSGLGLFISKDLVELMGGSIYAQSKLGEGAKFVFTIKAEQTTPVESESAPSAAHLLHASVASGSAPSNTSLGDSAGSKSKRILIVEDNVVNQKVLRRHLENAGYQCTVAENGQVAVTLLSGEESPPRYHFDFVFMDMEMPVMGGVKATRLIREREVRLGISPIPVVGLSGNARQTHITEAMDAGMNQFIIKPYQKDDMLQVIQRLTAGMAPTKEEAEDPPYDSH